MTERRRGDEPGGEFARLPDRPTGLWRVVTEHETTFHFAFGDDISGWIRTPADSVDRPTTSDELDARWRTLRFGPCLTAWPDGSSHPKFDGDDGWPTPGLAVGMGFAVGDSFFSHHWYSTVVSSIERVERDDLPPDVRRGLLEWERTFVVADGVDDS